ncbi:MAG: c-type cytochrome biogenesis protein CcsB [Desulfobacterales bacterium]
MMQTLAEFTILFYVMGTAGYFAYLLFQKGIMQKFGLGMLAVGFVCHTAAIGVGTVAIGHIPVNNLNQTLLIASWAVVGVFLWIQYRYRLKILGIYAAPLAALIMIPASRFSGEPAQTKSIFDNIWFVIHIAGVFLGEAFFALACGIGILYLVQEHAIKSKTLGFSYKRLPPLEMLDMTGYACIAVGFILLTLGLITGFVYARHLWGSLWSWDPKEVWSAITWLIYAALLHQRLTIGWRGRRSAILAIIGFAAVLFTFFGVNFLLHGHHQEFTRW